MESFIAIAAGWIIFAVFLGFLGKSRECGFGEPFLLSFFLGPIIGILNVFNSRRLSDVAHQDRMFAQLKRIAELQQTERED